MVFPHSTSMFIFCTFSLIFTTLNKSYIETPVTEALKCPLKNFTAVFFTVYVLCYPQTYKFILQGLKFEI
jgi:hypothetical protein